MRQFFMLAAMGLLAACGGGTETTAATDATIDAAPEPPPAMVIDITGEMCGGHSGVFCPGAFYCEQPLGECLEIMDGAGTCQPQPEVCAEIFEPVCGCDGQTYSNACEASLSGISVAAEGECATLDTF